MSSSLSNLCVIFFSVKHEYEGEWIGNKTRLTTCDPHLKRSVVSSDNPQEVEANKEIIFTFDVEFKASWLFFYLQIPM